MDRPETDRSPPSRPDGVSEPPDDPPDDSSRGPATTRTRRGFLGGLGAVAGVATGVPRLTDAATVSFGGQPPVRTVVYPESAIGWEDPGPATHAAVSNGMGQVWMAYATAGGDVGPTTPIAPAERGPSVPRRRIDTTDRNTVKASFRSWLDGNDHLDERSVHLLLVDAPLQPSVGYGGAERHLVAGETGAVCYANVGATEAWDGRAVTKNIAVHEVLHNLIDGDAVSSVVDSTCDHNLGSVVATREDHRRVSPMATAYADASDVGGETRWHGTGCWDHEAFYEYDPPDDVEETTWSHTLSLSDGTVAAVTHYLKRALEDGGDSDGSE